MNAEVTPLVLGLGAPEIVVLLLVLMLLFGGKKLPELARGTGRALRIFKAETQGLMDDDDDEKPAINERRTNNETPSTSPKPENQRQSDDSDS